MGFASLLNLYIRMDFAAGVLAICVLNVVRCQYNEVNFLDVGFDKKKFPAKSQYLMFLIGSTLILYTV